MTLLPPRAPGTAVRLLATSDLGAATVPMRTSHGASGTCAGIVRLLEEERERGPTVWLDVGDLVVGHPAYPLLGERPWTDVADLPIGAAAAGNHDFDDGVDALLRAAETLSFPLLCANADVGLPATATIDTAGGAIGVIGLTHPHVDRLAPVPRPDPRWADVVAERARELRGAGVRWVVALLHDGVTWWPTSERPSRTAARVDQLEATARPWASSVDVILAGHNFDAWTGRVCGTPAGEPYLFATSVLVVDLADVATVRGVHRVPAVPAARPSRFAAVLDGPARRVVGELAERWLSRTGARHYLPDLLARALREATGADAGIALPGFHGTQAPVDGAVAALGPGAIAELDVLRLFGGPGYVPVVVALRPGEMQRIREAYAAVADPANAAADPVAWNWCRMPAGISGDATRAGSAALIAAAIPRLADWLDRDLAPQRVNVTPLEAVRAVLG